MMKSNPLPNRRRRHLLLLFTVLFLTLLQSSSIETENDDPSINSNESHDCPEGSTPAGNGLCAWTDGRKDGTDIDNERTTIENVECPPGSIPAGNGMCIDDDYDLDDDIVDDDDDDDGIGIDEDRKEEDDCIDEHVNCEGWAKMGECDVNPRYMLTSCRKSCDSCGTRSKPVTDSDSDSDESKLDPNHVDPNDSTTLYGLPQICEDSACRDALVATANYMESELARAEAETEANKAQEDYEYSAEPTYLMLLKKCKNQEPQCTHWASIGECKANPAYMTVQCAPACNTCRNLDYNYRCPRDPDVKNVIGPGDLHRMFERIVDGPLEDTEEEKARAEGSLWKRRDYNITVHSRPTHPVYDPNPSSFSYILDGPWVITVDDFVPPESCDRLIELGGILGYERSTDVGKLKFDGTSETVKSKYRTSHNAWCKDKCFEDELTKVVLRRIEELTGIPDTNSEHLQLLKYKTGQYYKQHHDYIRLDRDRPTGPRILTAYLYLNDVLEGGGTQFPLLGPDGIVVQPKKGRLLLWPSVLNDDPTMKDDRTDHEALPVLKGEKYGANGWIHLRDFKTPHEKGCT